MQQPTFAPPPLLITSNRISNRNERRRRDESSFLYFVFEEEIYREKKKKEKNRRELPQSRGRSLRNIFPPPAKCRCHLFNSFINWFMRDLDLIVGRKGRPTYYSTGENRGACSQGRHRWLDGRAGVHGARDVELWRSTFITRGRYRRLADLSPSASNDSLSWQGR